MDGGNQRVARVDGGNQRVARVDGGNQRVARVDGGNQRVARVDGGNQRVARVDGGNQRVAKGNQRVGWMEGIVRAGPGGWRELGGLAGRAAWVDGENWEAGWAG